jgi:O-antigen ligase
MASEKPLFGYGFAQFAGEVGSFEESTGVTSQKPRSGTGAIAHNAFLSVLVELGGIGLLLYGAIIWGVVREGLRGAQVMWPANGKAFVLALSAAYFLNGLFVNLHEPFTNCLYFGAMGLFAAASGDRAGVLFCPHEQGHRKGPRQAARLRNPGLELRVGGLQGSTASDR